MTVKTLLGAGEGTEPGAARSSSLNSESKTWSGGKDSKSRCTAESRVKSSSDTTGNTIRKITEPKKNEQRALEENRKTEEKNKSLPEGINDEIISVVIPNKCESAPKRDSKESKEPKGKQKRKTKAIGKREEKDKKDKAKEITVVKGKDEEGGLSDDSGSDGSSDKSTPEVRIQQPSKETNKTRQPSNASTDAHVQLREHQQQQQQHGSGAKPVSHTAASAESGDTCKERGKARKTYATADNAKSKKGEAQTVNGAPRPKNLEVPAKGQNSGQVSKSQSSASSPDSLKPSEFRHPGATSPHAIAAAVMSLALGKNMQTSSKENNFDEHELNKRKAYTKTSALSPVLSDSPPPTSPTMLSGSSRSSSYSSIVSSDSSNGVEQVKPPVVKGNKNRIKSTKSAPLEGVAGPSWSSAGQSIPHCFIFKSSPRIIVKTLPRGSLLRHSFNFLAAYQAELVVSPDNCYR